MNVQVNMDSILHSQFLSLSVPNILIIAYSHAELCNAVFCFFFGAFLWFGLTENLLSSLCINEHLESCNRAHGEHDCGHAAMKSTVSALEMRTGLYRTRFIEKYVFVCKEESVAQILHLIRPHPHNIQV